MTNQNVFLCSFIIFPLHEMLHFAIICSTMTVANAVSKPVPIIGFV